MHAPSVSVTPHGELSASASHIARRLVNRERISAQELSDAGIVSQKASNIVQSLSGTLRDGDPDRVGAYYFVFESSDEIGRFIQDLVGYDVKDTKNAFKKVVDQEFLKLLCLGEVSASRIAVLYGQSALPSIILCGLMEDDAWVLENCPLTWKQAVHSILRAQDRLDIVDQFVRSFRFSALGNPGPSGVSRLLSLMYIWTQGNMHAVRAVSNLTGSDAFEIIEATQRVDGITDRPAFEFRSISQFLKSFLAREDTVEPRLRLFLVLLAKAVEKTSEMIHSAAAKSDESRIPNIVIVDLNGGNFQTILNSFEPGFDLESSHITIVGDFSLNLSTVIDTRVEIVLSPALWFVTVSESSRSTIVVNVSPAQRNKDTVVEKFSSWKIDPQTIVLESYDHSGTSVQFSIIPGGFEYIVTRESFDIPSVTLRINGENYLPLSWSAVPLDETPVRSSSGLPTRPVHNIPTDLLPTLPVLPSQLSEAPKHIRVIGFSNSASTYAHLVSPWDSVVTINFPSNPSEWRIRDMVRECSQSDSLIVCADLLTTSDPKTSFLVGLLVGSCQNVTVLGDSPFVDQLRDQGIIR